MIAAPTINYLEHHQIDKQKWDDCIINATNSLIYARTFYLDNVCPGWCALAGNNYDWVLPLTHNKKFSIRYLYQPPFTQQLGIFLKRNTVVPLMQIVPFLQKRFRYCEVNWNYHSDIFFDENMTASSATNFIIDLNHEYKTISARYHKDLIKNLKRSQRFQPVYAATDDYQDYIKLYRQYYGSRMPHVGDSDYKNFTALCADASRNNMLICRNVTDNQNVLLATALLLIDDRRIYNMMNTTTEAGRKTEANHFLLDAIIHEFAEQPLLFDFEGSDLPGVKTFYENFGAISQPYYHVKYNRLPWPIKLWKR